MVQFLMKLLLKQRILAVYHDFHGELFAKKFFWQPNFIHLTPWRLGGFGDFRKKKQQFSVALPTP